MRVLFRSHCEKLARPEMRAALRRLFEFDADIPKRRISCAIAAQPDDPHLDITQRRRIDRAPRADLQSRSGTDEQVCAGPPALKRAPVRTAVGAVLDAKGRRDRSGDTLIYADTKLRQAGQV